MHDEYKEYAERLESTLHKEMDKGINERTVDNVMKMLKIKSCLAEMGGYSEDNIVETVEKAEDKYVEDNTLKYLYTIIDEYKSYVMYKEKYRSKGKTEDKEMMLQELTHMMNNFNAMIDMLYECTDCKEERAEIKEYLKKERNKYPV